MREGSEIGLSFSSFVTHFHESKNNESLIHERIMVSFLYLRIKIMNIPVSQLPSGGYGYSFADISVSPMTFLQITHYLENIPENDPLEKYLYEIKNLIDEDKRILDCYLMDVDFLIFYKKLITISDEATFNISINCPVCHESITKTISLEEDIRFKQIDRNVMEGAIIELGGHKYETIVPTVKEFFKVFEKYLKYRKIEDLSIIKTIALIKDFELRGNQVEEDVLGAKHKDITLLLALQELYNNRLEPIEVYCPKCNEGKDHEERRSFVVSVDSLITNFFQQITFANPIDSRKVLFKQVRQG